MCFRKGAIEAKNAKIVEVMIRTGLATLFPALGLSLTGIRWEELKAPSVEGLSMPSFHEGAGELRELGWSGVEADLEVGCQLAHAHLDVLVENGKPVEAAYLTVAAGDVDVHLGLLRVTVESGPSGLTRTSDDGPVRGEWLFVVPADRDGVDAERDGQLVIGHEGDDARVSHERAVLLALAGSDQPCDLGRIEGTEPSTDQLVVDRREVDDEPVALVGVERELDLGPPKTTVCLEVLSEPLLDLVANVGSVEFEQEAAVLETPHRDTGLHEAADAVVVEVAVEAVAVGQLLLHLGAEPTDERALAGLNQRQERRNHAPGIAAHGELASGGTRLLGLPLRERLEGTLDRLEVGKQDAAAVLGALD